MSELARAWVAWIAENALRGAGEDDLVAGLLRGGLDADRARAEVRAVLASPVLDAAKHLVERSAGVEQVARLRRELDPTGIAVREALDDDALYREFWTANRPVLLKGAASGWPAARWTPESLADRFGDVDVDLVVGRAADARWWRDRAGHTRRVPFRELLALASGPAGDDAYADGRTNVLDEPGLAPLRADLGLLPGLVGDGFPKAWIGPAGTVTPLHHDQSTGWLVQLWGTKRVRMASPLEPALLTTAEGVYNTVDPRLPLSGELAEVRWHTLLLEPGDALLVTVGWWHHVEALTSSCSVSMGGFRWPNAFAWYTPGR